MTKQTTAELQLRAHDMRAHGESVPYIYPSQVKRWTEAQIPHLVMEQIPVNVGEKGDAK